jgi:hypothetical protein
MRWNHTFRGGHYEYIERGEAEFALRRIAEAGERLTQALTHARAGGDVDGAYLDLIQRDWEALVARYGVTAGGRSDKPPES